MSQENNVPQEAESEEQEFQKFASQALRLHRRGSFETLLAQHLAIATASDPVTKARLVCEGSWMVPQDKLKLDMELVETVYMVSLGFINMTRTSGMIILAWGFDQNEENYKRFIAPWHKNVPLSFTYLSMMEKNDKLGLMDKTESESKRFFLMTSSLSLSVGSLQMLKSEFLRWAIPLIMQNFEKLSHLVDPDLYREMLGLLKPETKPEEAMP
jgi:hypothetical protein